MNSNYPQPAIGLWYQDAQHRYFEVVASDDDSIEIQFHDGNVEEVDMETWEQLLVISAAAPNDELNPFEELDFNEHELIDEGFQSLDWQSAADFD